MERSVTPDVLKSQLAEVHLIDVRRKADRDTSTEVLPGATRHDPARTCTWSGARLIAPLEMTTSAQPSGSGNRVMSDSWNSV